MSLPRWLTPKTVVHAGQLEPTPTVTPAPTPPPSGGDAAQQAAASLLSGVGAQLSGGQQTSFDSTLYGLPTQLQNVTLPLGGLIVEHGGSLTALGMLQKFINSAGQNPEISPSEIALIQTQLVQAGYYPSGYVPPNLGSVSVEDVKAFGKFLAGAANSALSAQAQGAPVSDLATLLGNQSQMGQAAAQAQDVKSYWLNQAAIDAKPIVVHTPDAAAVADDATRAYQQVLGRKPSQQELNSFVASFSASYTGAQYDRGSARAQVQYDYNMAKAAAKATGQSLPKLDANDLSAGPPNSPAQHVGGMRRAGEGFADLGATITPAAGSDPISVITSVARSLGVDPRLALAIAQHESGLNPNSAEQDHHADGSPAGMSVGLYQLNDNGEGAGMTVAQRQDPTTNARIALSVVASVARAHPDWSPGQIAAAAQRPADPQGYAQVVNSIYASNRFSAAPPSSPTALTEAAANMSMPAPPTPSEIVTPGVPDAAADALANARKNHPTEAGAHDVADTFGMFLDLIKGSLTPDSLGAQANSPVPPG